MKEKKLNTFYFKVMGCFFVLASCASAPDSRWASAGLLPPDPQILHKLNEPVLDFSPSLDHNPPRNDVPVPEHTPMVKHPDIPQTREDPSFRVLPLGNPNERSSEQSIPPKPLASQEVPEKNITQTHATQPVPSSRPIAPQQNPEPSGNLSKETRTTAQTDLDQPNAASSQAQTSQPNNSPKETPPVSPQLSGSTESEAKPSSAIISLKDRIDQILKDKKPVPTPDFAPTQTPKKDVEPAPEKEIGAKKGEVFSLPLDGKGWIFQGVRPSKGMELSKREMKENKTVFSFLPSLKGVFVLSFQWQDLQTGQSKTENIKVNVEDSLPETASTDSVSPVAKSQPESKAFTWQEELAHLSTEEDFLPWLDKVFAAKNNEAVIKGSEAFLSQFPSSPGREKVYYNLAKTYDLGSPTQDLKQSVFYYTKLTSEFPLSLHRKEAKDRKDYLERRFFKISTIINISGEEHAAFFKEQGKKSG